MGNKNINCILYPQRQPTGHAENLVQVENSMFLFRQKEDVSVQSESRQDSPQAMQTTVRWHPLFAPPQSIVANQVFRWQPLPTTFASSKSSASKMGLSLQIIFSRKSQLKTTSV